MTSLSSYVLFYLALPAAALWAVYSAPVSYFNAFCQTNYLNVYRTELRQTAYIYDLIVYAYVLLLSFNFKQIGVC